jgi:hypothetical protein
VSSPPCAQLRTGAGIQHAAAAVNDREFPAYWITRLRG